MNKMLSHALVILLIASGVSSAMQEDMPTSPVESVSPASTGSSSSSSSGPKKSNLKKTGQHGAKKKLQFTADTAEHTHKPTTIASNESKQEYQQELSEIDRQQKAAIQAQAAPVSEEEAMRKLISFVQTTIPEVEQIMDDCAKDIVEIWNFFCSVPTSPQMARENFAKLRLAIKDYEKNLVSVTNRFTGKTSDSVVEGYGNMLDTLKHQAAYQWNSNQEVEKLDDILSDYMQPIFEKANALYAQTKKAELDRMFSQIKPEKNPQEQYDQAVSLGHAFLDNSNEIENKVDAFMRQNKIKGYSKHDYLAHLYSKAKTEKKIVIERVWPYAQKIGQTKQSLMSIL